MAQKGRDMGQTALTIGTMGTLVFLLACGGAAPTTTPSPRATAPSPRATAIAAPSPSPTAAPQPTPTRLAVVATLAPAPAASPALRGARGSIVYAKLNDLGTSDPHRALSSGTDTIYKVGVFSGLLLLNQDGSRSPGLASKFEYSPDGKQINLTIRRDATFHDGSAVTPADVKFSFDRSMSPDAKAAPVNPLLSSITSVDLSGPDRVVLTFKSPDPIFMQIQGSEHIQGLAVVPKAYVERVGDTSFNDRPIGAGAYKFIRRSVTEFMELEAYDGYFGPDKPQVKRVRLQIVPEDSTRVAMLRAREADFAEMIPPGMVRDLEKSPGVSVLRVSSGLEITMLFNQLAPTISGTERPNPFRDARVRRAVAYAIDRKAIVDQILRGEGLVMNGPWADGTIGADASGITPYPYDPQMARRLLEEAKFPSDVEFPVYYYAASPAVPKVFEAVADYLNKAGIKAVPRLVEVGAIVAMWRGRTAYPMTMMRSATITGGNDPVATFDVKLVTGGQLSQYSDPTIDKLVSEGKPIFDIGMRDKYFRQLWKYTHEQALIIPLYVDIQIHGLGPRIDWRMPGWSAPVGLRWISWRAG